MDRLTEIEALFGVFRLQGVVSSLQLRQLTLDALLCLAGGVNGISAESAGLRTRRRR